MHVPFVDLRAQHAPLTGAIEGSLRETIERGDFIMGAAVERFETEYAAYIGTRHALGVGTGLSAIELALRAFDVGPGDEVIAPANTFIATVLAIMAVGARPVFVDMDASSYGIDARAVDAAIKVSDDVFAAVAAAVWRRQGHPPVWPTRRRDGLPVRR